MSDPAPSASNSDDEAVVRMSRRARPSDRERAHLEACAAVLNKSVDDVAILALMWFVLHMSKSAKIDINNGDHDAIRSFFWRMEERWAADEDVRIDVYIRLNTEAHEKTARGAK